ncbi:MAG: TetR-like C-terminal domain-containing protein [Acidobacteriota bacterium]
MAGVSVAAPYRHFADKDALVAELIADGNALLERELRAAAGKAESIPEQMLEAGIAYIRFARKHADYFAVMFYSGIDKSQYPEMRESAMRAFGVIRGLAEENETSKAAASERALTLWALTHGLATLSAEGALAHASNSASDQALFRTILKRSIGQKLG